MSKLSDETQDLLLKTKIDDVLRESLLKFLEKIGQEPRAEYFLTPVDQKAYPHYKDVVKRPMDLSTMEMKVKGQRPRGRKPRVPRPTIEKYQYVQDVFNDLEQIWINCMTFNRPDCDAYAASVEMQATARALVDDWVVANIPNARMKEIDPSPTVRLTAEVLREVSEAEGEPEA
ncbi:bromodomain-containing protein, putative, partial [Perkinsus marinus ATCC 50983]